MQRYARRFNAVEINTSFYRDHRSQSYAKWREAVPPEFQFSVKLSKEFTHAGALLADADQLLSVLEPILELREKLGVILVQLPPKLEFNESRAYAFLKIMRTCFGGNIALEPRNRSWFGSTSADLMNQFRVSRVIADPCPISTFDAKTMQAGATEAGASEAGGFLYYRLHGTPKIYKSNYENQTLQSWADEIKERSPLKTWCVFDNTTFGYATLNALELLSMLTKNI